MMRHICKFGLLIGIVLFLIIGWRHSSAMADPLPGGTMDPMTIQKYVDPLPIPKVMPKTTSGAPSGVDYYEIAARQFHQQVLSSGKPETTVWGYGSVNHSGTFSYPARTIEALGNRAVRVKWINGLKSENGEFLPHLLPIDQTLHWANPPGGTEGRDMRSMFMETPGPYTGPVPLVTHLHGAHVEDDSDGYPEAWFLPAATNIPAGYADEGSWYNFFRAKNFLRTGAAWAPGSSVFQYRNDQRATTLWYHDHTLGMTRANVYTGLAGFYLLRGGASDMSLGYRAPKAGDPEGISYTEIPLVIQDRSFNADGSFFYPATREFFDGYAGPFIPETDIPPIWNPEFFGNTMVVNGKTWPKMNVEKRRYRFRFLNASDSRFLILQMSNNMPFWVIGTDGGFLPAPVRMTRLLIAPAERFDAIIDFSNMPAGTSIILQNVGPDEPFGGGEPGVDFISADPGTTGQVMKFKVIPRVGKDTTKPPAQLKLPRFTPDGPARLTRQVSLNEIASTIHDGPAEARLGIIDAGNPVALQWMAAITENPKLGATEVWEIFNFTEDAHPIHLHQTMFQVVNREALVLDEAGMPVMPVQLAGDSSHPEIWESGFKDTVIAYPGQVTRLKARFDITGLYVWHCHILSHEDNEMMRPLFVGTSDILKAPYKVNAFLEGEMLF